MSLLHDNISPLIESQFPAFYREEGPLFVEFVKQYYVWMEQSGNPLYQARHLLDYRDVDSTLDEFLPHFQNKFLRGTPTVNIQHQRDLIKHSRSLYQTKGTIESLRLIFRMLFGEDVDVYYPGDDILRASDGEWVTPRYIEISIAAKNMSLIGRDITGSQSGAKAFVDRIDRKTYKGRTVDVAYLSNLQPNQSTGSTFVYGEYVSIDGILADCPTVVGSLTRVDVTAAGSGFAEGEVVNLISDRRGRQGTARVTSTGNRTGEVNYRLMDGGYGYTLNANLVGTSQKVYVSANVLSLTSFMSSDPYVKSFPEFSTLVQPLATVSFSTANTTFASGNLVYGVNSSLGVIASGVVLNVSQALGTGTMLLSPHTTAKISVDTLLAPNTVTGSFSVGEYVYQAGFAGNTAVGSVVLANASHIVVDQRFGPFANGATIYGSDSGCRANAATVSEVSLSNAHFTNTSIARIVLAETNLGGLKTAVTNDTATANVVGSNSAAVGVFQITNSFKSGTGALVYSANSSGTAEVTVTSSGYPGSFKIGAITDTETVYVGTDGLGSNNTSNASFLTIPLNSTAYGFTGGPSANLSSVLATAFSKTPITIGSILSLTERNPGYDNTAKPFIVEIEQTIASYGKRSIINCSTTTPVGFFKVGELVTQAVMLPAVNVAVTSVTGTFDYSHREIVMQVRGDGVTTYGELYTSSVTGGAGVLRIFVANTANTFDTSNTIVGMSSNAHANVSSTSIANVAVTAKGIIVDTNQVSTSIKRNSFQNFIVGGVLFGSESGATCTVTTLQEDNSSDVLGNNAYVDPQAGVSDGTINTVEVVDSGFFYEDGETLSIESDNNQITGSGIARVQTMGQSQGYWRGDRGTLDSTKRIQDGEYYQEYSYEIRAGLNRQDYESAVKSITHVAGTKMFSKYAKTSTEPSIITKVAPPGTNSIITLMLSSMDGSFELGEIATQTVAGNVVASGYVLSFDSGLNKLQVANTTGQFTYSQTVVGASSTASGTIDSINISLL